ncbi:hypothetical protein NIES4075_70900 [Tolypothrix sp. NIES-4075]|uniref:hypothetical protein n=1 Tax=Tolypothrix sp. NIES-4075 TaxID=2005459 RepID=UPI000B6F41BC|nr:hypothetical protein [Tolypothrix sp. NIES-4075]GAX46069.1 hypothetical protein NIES4075_70900 [Tolypothrix sp. NIES-4075]
MQQTFLACREDSHQQQRMVEVLHPYVGDTGSLCGTVQLLWVTADTAVLRREVRSLVEEESVTARSLSLERVNIPLRLGLFGIHQTFLASWREYHHS